MAHAVIGTAFALNILFHIPIWVGVLITGSSTMLLLGLQRYGVSSPVNIITENFSIHAAHERDAKRFDFRVRALHEVKTTLLKSLRPFLSLSQL